MCFKNILVAIGTILNTYISNKNVSFRKILLLIIVSFLFSCNTEIDKTLESLPFSESIIYTVDLFEETSDTSFKMEGWAFVDGIDTNKETEYYLALKNNNTYDLFKFKNNTRSDVTNHFKSKGLNLDHSGFKIDFKHDAYTFKNEVALYIYYPDIQKEYAVLINNSLSQF